MLSEVVSSITVVDREGRVVASDRWPTGKRTPKPELLFGGSREIRRAPAASTGFFRGGDYVLDVPLSEDGALVGYLQVELQSRRVTGLFAAARRQLLIAAVTGLAGVVVLGGLLQFQVSRRAAAIAHTLETVIQGPERPARTAREDEFSRALKAAGQVREALDRARRESTRLRESFSALSAATKVGILRIRNGREPDFANPRALELLGLASFEELKAGWNAILAGLLPSLTEPGTGTHPAPALQVELPGGGPATLRVEPYRLGGPGSGEFLVVLSDPELLDTLETDVRLANQLQAMARVYRTVAHELRAPLGAMMIHLDLLRESLADGEHAEGKDAQQRYVVVLREELERLNRSLSTVLTQTLPANEPRDKFDLREALGELGLLLAPQARRQSVTLDTRLPDAPVVMVGYRDRLKQSFLNVAVNALEAMPGGGRMSLEMETAGEGSEAVVRIGDTGRGIPEDLLARIYEQDFTTKGSGSGIGLYVARALVEMHGGRIQVRSEEGRGTRVEVRLPIVARD
jgi:signal transduction histidine kinase